MDVKIEDIEELVSEELGREHVVAKDRIVEDLGAESLDVASIITELEDRYDIHIEETELPDLVTVADLFDCVRRHLSGGAA